MHQNHNETNLQQYYTQPLNILNQNRIDTPPPPPQKKNKKMVACFENLTVHDYTTIQVVPLRENQISSCQFFLLMLMEAHQIRDNILVLCYIRRK